MEVSLQEGETFFSEPSAIMAYSGEVEIKSEVGGDLLSGALRALGGGESLFINKISANSPSTIEIVPPFPSEIVEIDLDGALIVGDGAYLCHYGEIELSTKFGGLTAFTSGSGLMFLYAKGKGKLYLSAFGNLFKKELKEGEVFYVDNSSFVACNDSMEIDKIFVGKNLLSKVVGGEGLFFKIKGPGEVYYRTDSPQGLAALIARYIPKG